MNKKITILAAITLVIVSTSVFYFSRISTDSNKKIIAVLTTLSHPALAQVHEGIISVLKNLPDDFEIIEYNAEGSMQSANLIARQIANNDKIVGIFTIATLAAQTMAKLETTRPIVAVAISDAKAILRPDRSSQNICGVTDDIDADFQISTILDLLPQIKKIALLYSPSETNSSSVAQKLSVAAKNHDVALEFVGVFEPQQISNASMSACKKADAILIPLDNQLAAAMSVVIKATKHKPCPVIISDEILLHHGASIAFGVDYKKSGVRAGEMMLDIINNKKTAAQIGFINPNELGVYVNMSVVKEKNIVINPAATTTYRSVTGAQ